MTSQIKTPFLLGIAQNIPPPPAHNFLRNRRFQLLLHLIFVYEISFLLSTSISLLRLVRHFILGTIQDRRARPERPSKSAWVRVNPHRGTTCETFAIWIPTPRQTSHQCLLLELFSYYNCLFMDVPCCRHHNLSLFVVIHLQFVALQIHGRCCRHLRLSLWVSEERCNRFWALTRRQGPSQLIFGLEFLLLIMFHNTWNY